MAKATPLAASTNKGLLPASAAIVEADACLIALGFDLRAAWDRQNECMAAYAIIDETAYDAAYEVCDTIVRRIEALSARTLAGLKAKALAVSWTHGGDPITGPELADEATTDIRLCAAIVHDLLAL